MKNLAEIIFVGLSSFLNVHNSVTYDMPPPSVIVLEDHGHTAFIAFHDDEVAAVDGAGKSIGLPAPNSKTLRYIVLNGEELTVLNGPTGLPVVSSSFDAVASAAMYAPESKHDVYDEKYVPKAGGKPDPTKVAAFMKLGGGSLGRGRLTAVPYVFQMPDDTEKTVSGRFAEEVIYSFTADRIKLRAVKLADTTKSRDLTFLHKSAGQGTPAGIRIWIGAATGKGAVGIASTIQGKHQGPFPDATHMALFNEMFQAPDGTARTTFDRIPRALRDPAPAPARMKHPMVIAAEAGYCGPDQKP